MSKGLRAGWHPFYYAHLGIDKGWRRRYNKSRNCYKIITNVTNIMRGYFSMKRREISLILAGFLLFLIPLQIQTTVALPDLLPVNQMNINRNITGNIQTVTNMDVAQVQTASLSSNPAEEEFVGDIQEALGESVGSASIFTAEETVEDYKLAYERAKNANWGYTNLGIADVSDNLNVRAAAAEDGKLVGKLPKDAACEVLDMDDTWVHIKSGSVEGYVSREYLLTGIPAKHRAEELATTVARVTTDSLKVRAEANTDSEVITMVPMGEELEVAAVEGDWVKVLLDNEEAYVSAEFVEVSAELGTAVTMSELLYGQGISDVRVDICQYAKEFLGNPYVWGGTSLTKGTDCSGYVMSLYKKYGVSLPHSSRAQANCGTTIKVSEAQPGDLIFYGNGKNINHVAMYIGGGQVIHASNPKTGIRISNVSYRTPCKAVRILQD